MRRPVTIVSHELVLELWQWKLLTSVWSREKLQMA